MKKPVFVSHIHEEKDIALLIKKLIDDSFLGLIDVFVSSDTDSNAMGDRWLDNISNSLKNCTVEIVICSLKSVQRPWIHFEAGAGWVRDIPVIPVCHSGMTPSKLPIPLNLLNGVTASEVDSVKHILPVMARALGSKVPHVDLSEFVNQVRELEQKYVFWDLCSKAFAELKELFGQHFGVLISHLRENKILTVNDLPAEQIPKMQAATSFLSQNQILSFSGPLAAAVGPTGTTHLCRFSPGSRTREVLADSRFKP